MEKNEFLAKIRDMITNDYGVEMRPITSRNLQGKAILKRVHQAISNIQHTFKVQDMEPDEENS